MIKNLTMLCLGVLLLGGCTKEPDLAPSEAGSGKLVSSRFVLQREIPGQIETRAVDENAVNNLWVVQCVGSNVTGTPAYLSSNINLNDVAVTLAASNGTVYFFANTGNASLLTGVTTEAQVQACVVNFTYNASATASLPMFGQWTGIPVDGIITTPVSIYRAVTKVTFNLSSSLPASPELKLSKVQLKRVPKNILLARSQESLETGTYPAAVADDFTDLAASFDNTAGEVLTDTKTFTWYLPENHRGTGTALSQKNKTGVTAASGQGDYCTYVEITFLTTDTDKYTFRIWLGANNYNDYNLQRNTHYTVSTRILGMNMADTRITFEMNQDPAIYLGPGGPIVGSPATGYKFSKVIYAATADASSSVKFVNTLSSTDVSTDFVDGKSNTLNFYKSSSSEYLAINTCFKLNDGYASINTTDDPRFKWFVPSTSQGYIMAWSQGLTQQYFTSSLVNSTTSYSITGTQIKSASVTSSQFIRCVREGVLKSNYEPMLYKEASAIVIDFRPQTGFPQHLVESVKGKKIASGTPSDSNGPMTNNGETGTINKTIYQKLEVAKADGGQMSWSNAYLYCQRQGEGWRLPTQRELMLIYIFKDAIVELGGTAFLSEVSSDPYWTSTEYYGSRSWYMRFSNGDMSDGSKTYTGNSVRCVREL